MSIQPQQAFPAGTLFEYVLIESEACPIGPNPVKVPDALKGKKIVIFGLPGAFTPTCSERHLPGYLENFNAFKTKGVDEIWCFAVNDAFVMGAWGKSYQVDGKIRMIGDGSGTLTRELGLELDLSAKGLGVRCKRFSMLVEDGVVKQLNVEPSGGGLEISDAATLLKQL